MAVYRDFVYRASLMPWRGMRKTKPGKKEPAVWLTFFGYGMGWGVQIP